MPTMWPPGPTADCSSSKLRPVPQPTSSTVRPGSATTRTRRACAPVRTAPVRDRRCARGAGTAPAPLHGRGSDLAAKWFHARLGLPDAGSLSLPRPVGCRIHRAARALSARQRSQVGAAAGRAGSVVRRHGTAGRDGFCRKLETVCNRKGCRSGRCQPGARCRVIMLRRDNLSALEVCRYSDGAVQARSRHLCIRKLIKPQENLTMKKTLSSLTVAALAAVWRPGRDGPSCLVAVARRSEEGNRCRQQGRHHSRRPKRKCKRRRCRRSRIPHAPT